MDLLFSKAYNKIAQRPHSPSQHRDTAQQYHPESIVRHILLLSTIIIPKYTLTILNHPTDHPTNRSMELWKIRLIVIGMSFFIGSIGTFLFAAKVVKDIHQNHERSAGGQGQGQGQPQAQAQSQQPEMTEQRPAV
jgi:hypothetical protein